MKRYASQSLSYATAVCYVAVARDDGHAVVTHPEGRTVLAKLSKRSAEDKARQLNKAIRAKLIA
jgi:hypothetical protein